MPRAHGPTWPPSPRPSSDRAGADGRAPAVRSPQPAERAFLIDGRGTGDPELRSRAGGRWFDSVQVAISAGDHRPSSDGSRTTTAVSPDRRVAYMSTWVPTSRHLAHKRARSSPSAARARDLRRPPVYVLGVGDVMSVRVPYAMPDRKNLVQMIPS